VKEENEEGEQSHFSTEPIFFNAAGKKLNKRERQQLYEDKEAEFRQIIQDEAKEKANDDLSQEQYQSIIRTMAIKLPPMKRTTWELEAIKANTILDPRIEVPWAEPHHFMTLGKFAHIYIPKYVYIPKGVFKKSSIQLDVDNTSYTAFWRHLREAQQEAQRLLHTMLDHEQLRSLYKTDHRKMLKGQLPKTSHTSRLEIIQHNQAHIEAQRIRWKKMKPTDIYDWFIRPIEKLFTIDMPRGATLLRAMLYPQSAKHLLTFIKRYTGIPRGE